MLSPLDYAIVLGYFAATLGVGFYFSRRAGNSIDDYFLGGRSIPWFILGVSGVATYLDMSGTMMQTSFFYMLGAKGYWVCYRGAICLQLAFLMVFMGKWHRRSGAMTNPGLLELRFGRGAQGELARLLSTVSILILAIAFLAYFFIGSGKFLHTFLPEVPPDLCALGLFLIILIYAVASGFYGVVYTDLLQAGLILVTIGFVTFKALSLGTPEYFAEHGVSLEWFSFRIPWHLDTNALPENYEGMKFFALLLMFWILSNIFIGFSLPIDAWSSQRYYAARDERESSLVAFQWILLFTFRFFLMMGLGVLALGLASDFSDPEQALPLVIARYFPIGIKGAFVAALIAAAMSTIDSTLNSCAAYFVKDVYQRYIQPNAGNRRLVIVSYTTTVVLLVGGILVGWNLKSIDRIWGWIMMSLFTGVVIPNILKWFWWRFNGYGFAGGMIFGLAGATIQFFAFPNMSEYASFSFILALSTAGSILGVFCGPPADMGVLVEFYRRIRPFGLWKPVRDRLEQEFLGEIDRENRRDQMLLLPAAAFQLVLFYIPVAFVLKQWTSVAVAAVVLTVLASVLYKYWYKNLKA